MRADTKVTIARGTTGPAHDPYGYEILTVTRYGVEHDLTMCGLRGCCYERDGEMVADFLDDGDAVKEFTKATGANPASWERYHYRSKERCKCGCRRFRYLPGYPGETFTVCADCGNVIDTDFNESAVI